MGCRISTKVPEGKIILELFKNLKLESSNMSENEVYSSFLQSSLNYFLYDENLSLLGIIRGCGDSIWSMNIDFLVIRKEEQRKGYGTLLVNKFLETCKSKYITVCSENKNYEFYKRFGFKKIEDGYFQIKR